MVDHMDPVDRVVTGAHYGLRDWIVQRVTAVIMAIYIVLLTGYVLLHLDMGYAGWVALFSHSIVRAFTLLFLLAMYYHAWVGVREIVMDYVKSAPLRLSIYVLVIVTLVLYVIWTIQILWGV
jgi:succinate dehydrogenase / fumarate reductase, membrane anchor subunit